MSMSGAAHNRFQLHSTTHCTMDRTCSTGDALGKIQAPLPRNRSKHGLYSVGNLNESLDEKRCRHRKSRELIHQDKPKPCCHFYTLSDVRFAP